MTSVIAMVMAMAKPMAIIDWLKSAPPTVQIGDRTLPLAIRRLPQARRMTLRLAPDGSEVRISMPRWGRTDEAVAFARTRADWLARQLEALPSAESLGPGSTLRYRGNLLAITHAAKARRKPEVGNGTITIGGPEESMAARLQRWLESEARALLAQDLADYCARAAQPLPKIALSRAQRRWGSCSGKRMILTMCGVPLWRMRWRIWSISITARASTHCWANCSKATSPRPTTGSSVRDAASTRLSASVRWHHALSSPHGILEKHQPQRRNR